MKVLSIKAITPANLIMLTLGVAMAALAIGLIGYCIGCAPMLYAAGVMLALLATAHLVGLAFALLRGRRIEPDPKLIASLDSLQCSQGTLTNLNEVEQENPAFRQQLEDNFDLLPAKYDPILARLHAPAEALEALKNSKWSTIQRYLSEGFSEVINNYKSDSQEAILFEQLNKDLNRDYTVTVSLPSTKVVFSNSLAGEDPQLIGKALEPIMDGVGPDANLQKLVKAVLASSNQRLLMVKAPIDTLFTFLGAAERRSAARVQGLSGISQIDIAVDQSNKIERRSIFGSSFDGLLILYKYQDKIDVDLVEKIESDQSSSLWELALDAINPYFYGWNKTVSNMFELGVVDDDLIDVTNREQIQRRWARQQALNLRYDDLFQHQVSTEQLRQAVVDIEGLSADEAGMALAPSLYWRALESVSPDTMDRVKSFLGVIKQLCDIEVNIDALIDEALVGENLTNIKARCKLSFIDPSKVEAIDSYLKDSFPEQGTGYLQIEGLAGEESARAYLKVCLEEYSSNHKHGDRPAEILQKLNNRQPTGVI